jgi:hypothetical protein
MHIVTKSLAAGVLFLLIPALSASAQVNLSIGSGRVTLVATNATVRQILVEWARVGRTNIVNVERIPGGPLTLQLTNVPESEALDLLLGSVAGYLAVPRRVPVANLSRYDRILVLPTAGAARVPVAATAAPTPESHQPKGPRQPFNRDPNDAGLRVEQPVQTAPSN